MRIAIPTLPSPDSLSLKAMLEQAGYLIVTEFPSYTVRVQRGSHPWIVLDVPDAIFGRLLTHRIGENAPWHGVFVKAAGLNKNDKAANIEVPDNDPKALEAVCVGTMRALDQLQQLIAQPAKVAGQPFLNASELLANAVELIQSDIAKASTTIVGTLSQVVTDSHTLTAKEREQMRQEMESQQTSINDALHAHITASTETTTTQIFDKLMAYYQRPRWWHRFRF